MADDVQFQSVTLATPSAGVTVATDDVGGAHFQRVKLDLGGDGVSVPVVTAMPVSGPLTDTQLRASAVPVSGTFFQATQPVSGTVAVSGNVEVVNDAGNPLPVSGTVEVVNDVGNPLPVSGTFWQATQPVSAASLPLPTGAATEATLATHLTESDFDSKVGSLTETAPASDTASSGLNGRLQRIAQRLTSLIALIPAALGQGTMAQSLRVVFASDQSTLPAGGNVAHDAVDSGNPLKIGGKAYSPDAGPADVASADRADLFMDLKGRPVVYWGTALDETNDKVRAVTEGYKTTYSASFVGLAPAVAATDILEIVGSATKTVRVLRVQISGVATAAGAYNVQLIKRSTAATGGTSTSAAIVPHDSNDAAGTAVVKGYTANPTTGTLVGPVRSQRVTVSTAAGAIPIVPVAFDFTTRNGKGIVLRGVAQTLCLNLNAVTMTGGALDIDVEFTEE